MSETTQETPEMQAALARTKETWSKFEAVHTEMHLAEAELLRLQLIELADKTPGLIGYSFSVSYEYDDEGSYYACVNVQATWADDADEEGPEEFSIEDELLDLNPSNDTVAVLCSKEVDVDAEITVKQLRVARF